MALQAYHKYPGSKGEVLIAVPARNYEMLVTIRDMYTEKLQKEEEEKRALLRR